MPFKSKAEQAFLFAKKPKIAKEMAAKTPKGSYKDLPQYVGYKTKSKSKKNGKK